MIVPDGGDVDHCGLVDDPVAGHTASVPLIVQAVLNVLQEPR